MKIIHLLLLVICLTFIHSQTEQEKERVRMQEANLRTSIGMAYQNSQTFSFVCNYLDDFYIEQSQSQNIKGDIMTLWRIDDVYMPAEYQSGQELRLIIYEGDTSIIFDRTFYTGTGFSFPSQKGKKYTFRFYSNGNHKKLISATISKTIPKTETAADAKDLFHTHGRTESLISSLKNLLQVVQRNNMFTTQMSTSIKSATKAYMNFGIFQAIIILIVTALQVAYITKLVKTTSIV